MMKPIEIIGCDHEMTFLKGLPYYGIDQGSFMVRNNTSDEIRLEVVSVRFKSDKITRNIDPFFMYREDNTEIHRDQFRLQPKSDLLFRVTFTAIDYLPQRRESIGIELLLKHNEANYKAFSKVSLFRES